MYVFRRRSCRVIAARQRPGVSIRGRTESTLAKIRRFSAFTDRRRRLALVSTDGDAAAARSEATRKTGSLELVIRWRNVVQDSKAIEFRCRKTPSGTTTIAVSLTWREIILQAGSREDVSALGSTLPLMRSERVTREAGIQTELIGLLRDYGARFLSALGVSEILCVRPIDALGLTGKALTVEDLEVTHCAGPATVAWWPPRRWESGRGF